MLVFVKSQFCGIIYPICYVRKERRKIMKRFFIFLLVLGFFFVLGILGRYDLEHAQDLENSYATQLWETEFEFSRDK